jgi:hypothetical protein
MEYPRAFPLLRRAGPDWLCALPPSDVLVDVVLFAADVGSSAARALLSSLLACLGSRGRVRQYGPQWRHPGRQVPHRPARHQRSEHVGS